MTRSFPLALGFALLAACATTPATAPDTAQSELSQTDQDAAPEPVERPFPDASIYPLLVAEFALRRGEYDTAMRNYMEQARVLDDAGVAAHTTHLAQFLQDDARALEAAQLWLAKEPDNLEANITASTLLARMGRPLEALPHMAVVARAGHQANFPSLLQTYSRLTPAEQRQLVASLEELAGEFPRDPALLLTLALAYADGGQYDLAQARLNALFEIEPEQHQALVLEARMLLQEQAPHPFAHIERVLVAHPDNARLRLEYARMLSNTDLDAARKQFEILSAQAPGDADLLLSLAAITREAGDASAARGYLQQVLETGERQDEAHFYLGLIAEDDGQPDEALVQYRQIGDGRQYLPAAQRVGEILVESGRVEAAQAWFEEQRSALPDRAEQLYGVEAEILKNAGHLDTAAQVLDTAIAADPESIALRYARSLLSQQRGDVARMEEDLRTILQRDPENATAMNALGYTLADQTDRVDEAYALISRALELNPGEPAILDSMGWVLYRKGDLAQSRDYLLRAYAQFPDPEVAAHLGEVLWASGEKERAREILRGGLLTDPGHRVLLDTLRRLGLDPAELAPVPPTVDTSAQ